VIFFFVFCACDSNSFLISSCFWESSFNLFNFSVIILNYYLAFYSFSFAIYKFDYYWANFIFFGFTICDFSWYSYTANNHLQIAAIAFETLPQVF
jgi:hypothetical protein